MCVVFSTGVVLSDSMAVQYVSHNISEMEPLFKTFLMSRFSKNLFIIYLLFVLDPATSRTTCTQTTCTRVGQFKGHTPGGTLSSQSLS